MNYATGGDRSTSSEWNEAHDSKRSRAKSSQKDCDKTYQIKGRLIEELTCTQAKKCSVAHMGRVRILEH